MNRIFYKHKASGIKRKLHSRIQNGFLLCEFSQTDGVGYSNTLLFASEEDLKNDWVNDKFQAAQDHANDIEIHKFIQLIKYELNNYGLQEIGYEEFCTVDNEVGLLMDWIRTSDKSDRDAFVKGKIRHLNEDVMFEYQEGVERFMPFLCRVIEHTMGLLNNIKAIGVENATTDTSVDASN